MRGVIFAVLLLLLSGAIAVAQTTYAEGNYTCAAWSDIRDARSIPNEVVNLESWIWGYLSALNVASGHRNADIVGGLERMDAAIAWVDLYCDQNPLKYVRQAAAALASELRTNSH